MKHSAVAPPRAVLLAGLAAVALAAFWFARNFVLFAYYEETVAVLDGGWFAGVLHGSDWRLTNPAVLGAPAGSYFATHVVPLFVPLTYAARALPLAPGEYMAVFLGAAFALYGALLFLAAVGFLARKSPPLRPVVVVLVAAPAAFLLALNGVSAEILHYPHFEVWIPILVCAFLLAWVGQKKKTAAAVFVALLAVREDAGLHLAASLLAVAFFRQFPLTKNLAVHRERLRAERALLLWSAAGIAYSVVAMNLGGVPAPRPNLFDARVGERLWSILVRGDWAPALAVAAAWAVYARRPALLVGCAALIPWVVYNAVNERALSGYLATYYGFPVLTALFWPLVAERFFPLSGAPRAAAGPGARGKKRGREFAGGAMKKTRTRAASVGAAAFVLIYGAATLPLRPGDAVYYDAMRVPKVALAQLYAEGAAPTPRAVRENIGRLRDFFVARAEELNIIVADGFASLHPHEVPAGRLLYRGPLKLEQDDAGVLIAHTTWMQLFVKSVFAARAAFDLRHAYRLRDSGEDGRAFFLFAKHPLCDADGQCVDDLPLEATRVGGSFLDLAAAELARDSFYFPAPSVAAAGAAAEAGMIATDAPGAAAELRGLPLAGRAALLAEYFHDIADGPLPQFEVSWAGGRAGAELPALSGGRIPAARLIVELPQRREVTARVIHPGGGTLRVFGLAVRPAPAQQP